MDATLLTPNSWAMAPVKKPSQKLLDLIARQMEISAEFSDGYFHGTAGTTLRLNESNLDPITESLIRSGEMRLIPTITSQDLYLWMVDFTDRVKDFNIKKEMCVALKGISSVWRFRNILYRNEELSREWEQFKLNKLRTLAEDWLAWADENNSHGFISGV